VSCGQPPTFAADRKLVGAVRFFYPDHDDVTVGAVEVDHDALPAAVDRIIVLVQPGEVVSPPPKGTLFGRIASATAVAGSVEECRDALDAAEAAIRVRPAAAG
jgi:hypothetical protein